jgi:GntR family transcriptional regulator, transcriptional repressor for pyruvate dehydrogenase complex
LRAALTAVQRAETATARQAADLAYFRVLIHCSRNRALGFLYRWVEHAFGGREHELTGGAAAAVEEYLRAGALRIVLSYKKTQVT